MIHDEILDELAEVTELDLAAAAAFTSIDATHLKFTTVHCEKCDTRWSDGNEPCFVCGESGGRNIRR